MSDGGGFLYPALYNSANQSSAAFQKTHLRLVYSEYFLLIIASVLSLDLSKKPIYFVGYTAVFLPALAIMLYRNWTKPEQSWYRARALAESIKTSCWRYCMRAEPFGDCDSAAVRRAEFRNHLKSILEANRHIGYGTPSNCAADAQITHSMDETRALSLDSRKELYDVNRIREQRLWYAKKAQENKGASKSWMLASTGTYVIAIGMVLLRIAYPNIEIWPIEPIIVTASSMIGWTQIKKFNELSSSYTLTAHEIGIIQGRIEEISSENEFSDFVNEAEQAFSREHTQWVARQQS